MIFALTTLFTPFFFNISETKRIITFKNGAKWCIKNSNLPKMSLTTLLHSAVDIVSDIKHIVGCVTCRHNFCCLWCVHCMSKFQGRLNFHPRAETLFKIDSINSGCLYQWESCDTSATRISFKEIG